MIQIRKILCPVDRSEISGRALDYAVMLSQWYGASLTAMEVVWISVPPVPTAVPATLTPLQLQEFTAGLHQFVEARSKGLTVNTKVAEGPIVANVVDEARKLPADLLVVGTHGRGGFERFVLGSVTEKLLRKSPCPVLTVPPAAPDAPEAPQPFQTILCAVDFSPASLDALDYALLLAQESGKRIVLLHVFDWDEDRLVPGQLDKQTREIRNEYRQSALKRLHGMVSEEARLWCTCEEMTATGRPHEQIVQVAAQVGADLIAIGAHGRRLSDILLGSTTNQVARHATCPVLTVRTP